MSPPPALFCTERPAHHHPINRMCAGHNYTLRENGEGNDESEVGGGNERVFAWNLCLEHKLSITRYNMETVVIESLFVKDRSEVI